ncbi:MAG: YeeE/YedE family protein [Rhodopirellula sp.]|nr:YeeE/YedE family protein [Rhodopirellula sp.]
MNVTNASSPYWNPYVAGVALGVVLFSAFALTGSGLGGSGGSARVMAFLEDQVAPAATDRNPYLASLAGGDVNPLNHNMIWMMLGVIVGGFISGTLAGRVKVETHKGPHVSRRERWALAFAGGGLMGFGAALARGCTSGQALSGGAVLSVGSWAFMMMVFAGAYLLAYPLRKLWNE